MWEFAVVFLAWALRLADYCARASGGVCGVNVTMHDLSDHHPATVCPCQWQFSVVAPNNPPKGKTEVRRRVAALGGAGCSGAAAGSAT